MYEVAKELTRPRHCAVIRLDDRDGVLSYSRTTKRLVAMKTG